MSSILYLANTDWYVFNFRLSLLQDVQDGDQTVAVITPEGDYGQRLRDNRIAWRGTRVFRTRRSMASRIMFFAGCVVEAVRERPKIVHAFTIECVVYASLMSVVLRSRAVYSLVGLGFLRETTGGPLARIARATLRAALKTLWALQSRFVVTVQNEEDHATLVEGGIAPAARVRLIAGGSGVNLDQFHPSNRTGSGGKPRALFASRLLWQKGIGDYIEAATELAESGAPYEFWIAGDPDRGNRGSVSDSEIENWSSSGIVEFLGHRDDMQQVLGMVDVVVLPTFYGEGVPRILIEAAASGLPLIASDHIGCRAVVHDGENGRLVAAHDSAALAQAMREVLDDPSLRVRMGRRSREIAEARFDEHVVTAKFLELYSELV